MIVRTIRNLNVAVVCGTAALATLRVGTVVGYERYNDGCQVCHGSFTDGTSPQGTVFPSNDKHRMHRHDSHMAAECDLCHTDGDDRNPFIGSSNGTEINPGAGCTGCHGRDYGGTLGNSGVGLRAHHAINGVGVCAACHPGDPVPLAENIRPTYYGTPDSSVDDPCNSGPDFLENWSVGDTLGLDNDGDNLYDTADPDVPTWYRDADNDGFGDASQTQPACDQPVGYVADDADCDDGDPSVHPGAVEGCDGVDTDCSGGVPSSELDGDGDGFSECEGDCDDDDAGTFPGAPELCDGFDNDCDGQIDQEIPTWFRDADGDGFGDPAASRQECEQPVGYVFDGTDCDDEDLTVFPNAPESCDGKDNDCDGALPNDEVDLDGDGLFDCEDNCPANANSDQADADGDGVGDACDSDQATPPEAAGEPNDQPDEGTEGDAVDTDDDSGIDQGAEHALFLLGLLGATLCGFGVLPAVAISSLGVVWIKSRRRCRRR